MLETIANLKQKWIVYGIPKGTPKGVYSIQPSRREDGENRYGVYCDHWTSTGLVLILLGTALVAKGSKQGLSEDFTKAS